MYLQLFHGRKDPREQLDDWGTEGPIIGPLEYVHTTYATDVKFGFFDKSKSDGWLTIVDGLLYYDGVYYGDWSSFSNLPLELSSRVIEFDQAKAKLPIDEKAQSDSAQTDDNLPNLLTAINGFAYLAQQNSADKPKVEQFLEQLLLAANRAAQLYRQFHIVRLHGGIEPEIIGPFPTEAERDKAAQSLRRENDEDVILALDGPGSSIAINAYSARFLNEELPNQ